MTATRHRRAPTIAGTLDEMPPAAIESEKMLARRGIILRRVNPDVAIEPQHFYREENATLWRALSDLDSEHGQFDSAMVLESLKAGDVLPGFDWAPYLAELLHLSGTAGTMAYHAAQIRRAYVNRTMRRRGPSTIPRFTQWRNQRRRTARPIRWTHSPWYLMCPVSTVAASSPARSAKSSRKKSDGYGRAKSHSASTPRSSAIRA